MVALAFIPNPDKKPIVHHIDHNKLNNMVNNLQWATDRENAGAYQQYKKEKNIDEWGAALDKSDLHKHLKFSLFVDI